MKRKRGQKQQVIETEKGRFIIYLLLKKEKNKKKLNKKTAPPTHTSKASGSPPKAGWYKIQLQQHNRGEKKGEIKIGNGKKLKNKKKEREWGGDFFPQELSYLVPTYPIIFY